VSELYIPYVRTHGATIKKKALKLVERRKSNVLNLNTHFVAPLCRQMWRNHSSNTPTPPYAPDEIYVYCTRSLGKWAYTWNAIYIK